VTGYSRIGGALILAGIIVLTAFFVGKDNAAVANVGAGLEVADSRTYIKPSDADGDGTPDWSEYFGDSVYTPLSVSSSTGTVGEEYTPPTTLTGKFSEAFFKDYIEAKSQGADFTDPSAFVEGAVRAIDTNAKSRTYSPLDIVVVEDSPQTHHEYGNNITDVIIRFSIDNENEALITKRAIDTQDEKVLKELDPIEEVYTTFISQTLLVPTPKSLVNEHLALLNAYEAIRTDVAAMKLSLSDPLYALARFRGYRDDATALGQALASISSSLRKEGVVYAKDEPGSYFYLLGI
jgi:hypothetical protein